MESKRKLVTCAECGGTDVQTVDWILPNTEQGGRVQLAQGEPYASPNSMDTNWCNTCDAHVLLNYKEIEAAPSPSPDLDERLAERITEHRGRYWYAWFDAQANQWTAPTPTIGGRYTGSKETVCSGLALNYATRRGLVNRLRRDGWTF